MNETNENNVNQTPVEAVSTPVTPVEATPVAPVTETPAAPVQETPVAPAAPVQPTESAPVESNTETESKPAENNQPVSESQEVSGDGSGEKKDNAKQEAKLRFPVVVVVIFVVFIIFMFVYYFVLITPKNLFGKALKAQMSGIIDIFAQTEDHKYTSRSYKIKTTVDTKGDKISTKDDVVFLDGLEYNFEIGRDIKNGNLSLNVLSNVTDFENVDQLQHMQNLDSSYYYYKQSIYAKASDAILKTDTHGDTVSNTDEIFALLKEAINESIDLIDVNKVERSITTKTIKNQSLLAIRFNTEFTNEEINKILDDALTNLLDNSKHPDFVKRFAENIDITEEEAKQTIESFKNFNIKAENIKLDYYLNLACTGIVAYELTVGDITILVSSLSGYYFVDIDSKDGKFDIDLNMNVKSGDFDFKVLLDNENTYTYVEGESVNVLDDKYIPIGNDLVIEIYEETEKNSSKKKDKPYLIIDTHTDFEYDKEIKFFKESDAIPFEQGSVEDKEEINYTIEKIGYEFAYLCGLNLVNRTDMTAAQFAKNIFNIEQDTSTPEVDTTLPEVDNVTELPLENEVVEDESDVVTDNNGEVEVPNNNDNNSGDVPVSNDETSVTSTKSE